MKMTEKKDRVQDLFKYLELLVEVGNKGHHVNRETDEAIQALRSELGLDKSKLNWDNTKNIYVKGSASGSMILNENGLFASGVTITK